MHLAKRLAVACAAATLLVSAPARAETPPDVLVMAKNIDDIITLDPAEVFEFSGGEIIANVYDRIMMFEPEDLETLVGGVAESWEIGDDGNTITIKLRPGLTFHSGNPVTAEDVAFSLQRVIKLDKSPAFILTQLGWDADNVEEMVKPVDELTVQLTIPAEVAPTLVLNCLNAGVGSVVDKQTVLAHEQDGDLGYEWLKMKSVSAATLSRIESGNLSPTFDVISNICAGFGVGIREFLSYGSRQKVSGWRAITRSGTGPVIETPHYRFELLGDEKSKSGLSTTRPHSLKQATA